MTYPTQKQIDRIINQELRGMFMQKMMFEKGWSREMARQHIVDYLYSGEKISIAQHMREAF